jgi:hypothetical protein
MLEKERTYQTHDSVIIVRGSCLDQSIQQRRAYWKMSIDGESFLCRFDNKLKI